jgi:hypothetical protein
MDLPSRSPLLCLPSELRLRILHFLLAGTVLPIDIWTTTLLQTIPLTHLSSNTLPIFHTNSSLRFAATSLIPAHFTLAFRPGPRSPFDRRWRTAGLPLPELFRANIAHVVISASDLAKDIESFPPLYQLPRLRSVRFQCQFLDDSAYSSTTFAIWQHYRLYVQLNSLEMQAHAVGSVEKVLQRHRWLRGRRPWSGVFESFILLPECAHGPRGVVECRWIVDWEEMRVMRTEFVMRETQRLA